MSGPGRIRAESRQGADNAVRSLFFQYSVQTGAGAPRRRPGWLSWSTAAAPGARRGIRRRGRGLLCRSCRIVGSPWPAPRRHRGRSETCCGRPSTPCSRCDTRLRPQNPAAAGRFHNCRPADSAPRSCRSGGGPRPLPSAPAAGGPAARSWTGPSRRRRLNAQTRALPPGQRSPGPQAAPPDSDGKRRFSARISTAS